MANNCNKTFRDLIESGQAQVLGIVSIVPMDDWNGTTTYQKLNYVRHSTDGTDGATYIAKKQNNNVEPGVSENWQDSWMLATYDGILVPNGTYPNLTAGKVVNALMWGNKSYDGSSPKTITAADLGLADVYKPQGSIAFSALPATPSADTYGYVWNITNDFTTDSRFVEGAGKQYSAGANVGVIKQNGTYYYDVLGNFIDLSNYAQVNGTYEDLFSGGMQATTLAEGADLNDCVPTEDGKLQAWYCNGAANSNTIINCPMQGAINSTFYLTALRTWHGAEATQYRVIQTLYRVVADGVQMFSRAVDRGASATANWGEWNEYAYSDGTYPSLTAGKAQALAKTATVATTNNSAQYGWWRFASLPFSTLIAITGTSSYSAILLVNSINPAGIDNTNAIQSGLIELELRLDGGEPTGINTNDVMKVLCGGLSPDLFCCTVSDTEIEFYVYLNAAYNRRNFTVLDEVYYNGEHIDALEFESTFVSATAPSGAIYAVNRNNAAYDGEGNEIATKYVTTDTSQTVTGQKTFNAPVNIAASGNEPFKLENIPEGGYKDLIFENNENTRIAGIRVANNLDDDDPNVTIMLGNNGPNNAAPAGITVRRNGSTTTAEAPVPPANDDSVKIATTSWVRDVVPGIKVNNATNADNATEAGTAEELTNVSIIRSGNATTNVWYKIAEITNIGTNGDASLLLLVNGTHEPQSSQWASPTGMIEFDARNQSGSLYAAASLNFGNIPTENVYAKINGSTAELWYKFVQGYEAIKVTVQSWNHNTINSCSFALFSDVSQASAPTGGSNAVPRMGTNKIWYGTCTTPAATAEKAVTCAGFTLEQGSAILVRMTNQHISDSNATLNVNGTGAALIYEKNSLLINNNNHTSWRPTDYCLFVYDGTYWVYVNSYSHNMYRSGTTLYINTCGDTEV